MASESSSLAHDLFFDPHWKAALDALERLADPADTILAPGEFMHFFDRFYPIHIQLRMIPDEAIDWILLHKGLLDRVDPMLAQKIADLHGQFANEVFVLLGSRPGRLPDDQVPHMRPVADWVAKVNVPHEPAGCAALVRTVDRPDFLVRCLASLVGQFKQVLVVDDGSSAISQGRNASAARDAGAEYIFLGRNRGSACGTNVGVSMLLSDLDTGWISNFDDDTEIAENGIARLQKVIGTQGASARRNLYSGYASPLHRVSQRELVAGETLLRCRSCSGQHLHAHRQYWEAVLPIPTPYHGAPKKTGGAVSGQGSDADWWCSNWAPCSAIKQGGSVFVLPELVTTFGEGQSTWGNLGI
ncbi:MAG: glycosyltransferase [Proteobacteria bacterium]|nr:glycosyltransferase [Pseudomonadota bacterium]